MHATSSVYRCTGHRDGSAAGCGASVQVAKDDLIKTFKTYDDGLTRCGLAFQCPYCRVTTDIDNSWWYDTRYQTLTLALPLGS